LVRVRLKVKEVAQQKGVSQGKLSRSSDVDIKTIKRIYRDSMTIVTTETLGKIATALNVDASELIENAPDENSVKMKGTFRSSNSYGNTPE
jgi:DNA-binding Xre family transcriptional regulator